MESTSTEKNLATLLSFSERLIKTSPSLLLGTMETEEFLSMNPSLQFGVCEEKDQSCPASFHP
jgi:hypothetical protein